MIEYFICSPRQAKINVATGQSISIKDLIGVLGEIAGISPKINYNEIQDKNSPQNLVFDVTHLRTSVPSLSLTDIHKGIDHYVSCLAKS